MSADSAINTNSPAPVVALVQGEPWAAFPKDLYVPPDALEVALETFAGPLDLLLYLIKKQNLDILDIPIDTITTQYMEYINLMQGLRLDLAAEYLVMAAVLAEIKSRMLLPKSAVNDENIDDPRANLARQLHEYAQFKAAAQALDALPRLEREVFLATAALPNLRVTRPPPSVTVTELLDALHQVLKQAELFHQHRVEKELFSVAERIVAIRQALINADFIPFTQLIIAHEGRMGVVVTFIAILELIKSGVVELKLGIDCSAVFIRAKKQTV